MTRIVSSTRFSRSDRLSSFLLYVCELDRTGRASEINEQQIGQVIFGRRQDYDPSADGIVRSHASRLRLRLDQYFSEEGADEPVRLHIPRGTYVPVFEATLADPETDSSADLIALAEPSARSEILSPGPTRTTEFARAWGYRSAIVLLLFIVTGLLAADFYADRRFVANRFLARILPSPSQTLWKTMFVPGRPTLLVVGDAGANMFVNMARRDITADEYSSDSWSKDPVAQTPSGFSWVPFARRTYTPNFAVNFAAKLAQISEIADGQFTVEFARHLQLENLKSSQAILLGGPNYDPWENLFSANRNFRFVYDQLENSISIYNDHPQNGEAAVYKWKQSDPNLRSGYSLITLTHNLNGTGRVLLLQGTTAQGDETAAEFVLDPARFNPILAKAIGREGQVNDFEALLETKFVAGGSIGTTVAAFRVHQLGLGGR